MLALVWKWRRRGRLYCKDGWVVNEDLGLEAQWWASFLSCSSKRKEFQDQNHRVQVSPKEPRNPEVCNLGIEDHVPRRATTIFKMN